MNIYRFMSFVELYELISKSSLKMSKLSLMDDINEGLGSALKLQESLIFGWGLTKKEKFESYHAGTKGRTYISCWTVEPEAMAMWLLYSKDKSAIRVKTCREKLESHLKKYFEKNIHMAHINSPEGTFQLDRAPVLEPVIYIDFRELSKKVKDKHKVYHQELINHDYLRFREDGLPKELNQIIDSNVISEKCGSLIKDKAYSHENEIRASFTGCLRNSLSVEEWEKNKDSDDPKYVFSTATSHFPDSSELPDVVSVPVDSGFIDEVCFDPRMPDYVVKTYSEILQLAERDIKIVESQAFGYTPSHYDFSIDI